MTAPIHTEVRFEDDICEHLRDHGWLFEGPIPYAKGHAYDSGYSREQALYTPDALSWVKETQPDTWAKFVKNHAQDPDKAFIRRLTEELDVDRPTIRRDTPELWGSLYILRRGFKDINATFKMAQFAPSNKSNPLTWEHYGKNRLRVMRQVYYSRHNEKSIDLVLFLNGIPLATLELKTDTTQSIEAAVQQYRKDRLPVDPVAKQAEPLLAFGKRTLVHFAVSTDEVRMTTRLSGPNTRFLPFNRGIDDGQGGASAGNPPDEKRGYPTAYFWHEVLQRDAFLGIIGKFVSVTVSESKNAKGKKVFTPSLLFPRYHQWSAVNALLQHTLTEGVGQVYLNQHSAGSGKSNTIGWLSHRLAALHDANDKKVYNCVIVITDRRVLDQQLQDTIYQFDHQKGVVEKIDKGSKQLGDALQKGKPIIITTLQKFPHVLKKVSGMIDKRFAVIIDEAHSSQSNGLARKLKEVLTTGSLVASVEEDATSEAEDAVAQAEYEAAAAADDGEELTGEDVINRIISSRKRPENVSYYAFTAAPKPKTLELFGRPGPDGLPVPFHVYSMRQAIEEGFILDVLRGYTTFDFAFKLAQQGSDEEVKSGKAKSKLLAFAQGHPDSITKKVKVFVEHFREHVKHQLDGQAKAMVVTDSRVSAVRYKKALDDYIEKHRYTDCQALVAFSGKVTDDKAETLFPVVDVSEGNVNLHGEAEDRIKEAFNTDQYQVLIVASKFQTGFDQPKLVAMYVDKRLDGVLAVQTLSRLNRTYPGKSTTCVIDFRNDAQDILKAFEPYYRTAQLSGITDRNLVHNLRAKLDSAGVYEWLEVEAFSTVYFDPKGKQAGIQNPLKVAHERFNKLEKEARDLFRGDLASYVSAYDFLSQLVEYDDPDLEKLHAFAKMLLPRLRGKAEEADNLDGKARLAGYKLVNEQKHKLNLGGSDEAKLDPMNTGGGKPWDDPRDRLSVVIKRMNEVFAGKFSDADFEGYATTLVSKVTADSALLEQALANDTEEAFANGAYEDSLNAAVIDTLENQAAMADQVLKSEKVFKSLASLLLPVVYQALRQQSSSSRV